MMIVEATPFDKGDKETVEHEEGEDEYGDKDGDGGGDGNRDR